jgi:hypothetical protein
MAVKLFLHRNLQLWSARGPEAPYRAQTGESLDPYLILELREGQSVTFEKGQGPKGPRAESVRVS